MSTSALVSVVIPAYECQQFIGEAIHSVLAQKNCDVEAIVVDDGSTDRTGEIVFELQRTLLNSGLNSRLRYEYQENQGVCAARNRGIQLAAGEFIAFLDADDFFLPDKLAAQLSVFAGQPELGAVHSGWRRVDSNGQTLQDVCPWEIVEELSLENWLRFKPVLPSAMMFRRSCLEAVEGFDVQLTAAEDVDLVWRLSLSGCLFAWLPRVTVAYRQHPDSAMKNGLAQARDLPKVLNKFFSRAQLPVEIRLIEREVRYSTLVWLAWFLYSSGQMSYMLDFLSQSTKYSSLSATELIVDWIERFVIFTRDVGDDFNARAFVKSLGWQQLLQRIMPYDNR
ncbi:MAG: glycosyltransferase family 2 protein [Synechococcus sp.]